MTGSHNTAEEHISGSEFIETQYFSCDDSSKPDNYTEKDTSQKNMGDENFIESQYFPQNTVRESVPTQTDIGKQYSNEGVFEPKCEIRTWDFTNSTHDTATNWELSDKVVNVKREKLQETHEEPKQNLSTKQFDSKAPLKMHKLLSDEPLVNEYSNKLEDEVFEKVSQRARRTKERLKPNMEEPEVNCWKQFP